METVEREANASNIPSDVELKRLVIHGLLHLDGMDHGENLEREPMLVLQNEILEDFSRRRVI